MLQRDGRMPYTTLASAVGLSEPAVRQRVKRLRSPKVGLMQIVAVTDPIKLGFRLMALVGISVEGDVEAVSEALCKIPMVEYVVITTGSYDLLVEVVCENEAQLLSLLNAKIRPIPGVRSTESFVYLRIDKQTYAWAAP